MSAAKEKGDTSATTKQKLYVIKGGKGGRKQRPLQRSARVR